MESVEKYLEGKVKQVQEAPRNEVERGYRLAVLTMAPTIKTLMKREKAELNSIGV